MRQLVTERTVRELVPIEGADKIELAKVDGWQCVVKKGEFEVGEKAIYFEIDSMIPADDKRFSFLSKGKKVDRYRIKSMKLRGALSQGLLIPMSNLTNEERMRIFDGETPTEVLRVEKYEPVIPMGGKQKGTFPTHLVPKTDQERIQNIAGILELHDSSQFEITEKLDGTSCTMWMFVTQDDIGVLDIDVQNPEDIERWKRETSGVASRNWEMQVDDENIYARMFKENDMASKLWDLGRNLAIQGEIIGPSIQGNKYKLDKATFFVFDIYDIDAKGYLNPDARQALAQELGLNHVPVLDIEVPFTLQGVLDAADGRSQLHDTAREGLVFKSYQDGVSFKAISNKWLLKNE